MTDPQHCTICGRRLNDPDDPLSRDLGGDCLACMAIIGEDPDAINSLGQIIDLYPNRVSEDYKIAEMARWSGRIVKFTGMTKEEKLASILSLGREEQITDLYPNRVSEDYKLVKKAIGTGRMVDTTCMTSEEFKAELLGRKAAADRGETIDVTHWTRAQIVERFLTDGVEAALELLDGTQEEGEEAYRAALRALDEDEERDRE